MKNLANILTASRIIFAVALIAAPPFSFAFLICYLCGGLSDIFDGFVARKLNQTSDAGARLDSIADIVFAASIAFVVIKNLSFPIWLWICAVMTALLRFIGYGIGYYKFRTFSSLHTYMNKAAGALLFLFPLFYSFTGTISAIVVGAVALVSAVEEILITVKSKELDRDRKSIFSR